MYLYSPACDPVQSYWYLCHFQILVEIVLPLFRGAKDVKIYRSHVHSLVSFTLQMAQFRNLMTLYCATITLCEITETRSCSLRLSEQTKQFHKVGPRHENAIRCYSPLSIYCISPCLLRTVGGGSVNV